MKSDYDLEIIPGKRVGKFQLGWDQETLEKHLDFEYTCEWARDEIISIKSDDFWFHLR